MKDVELPDPNTQCVLNPSIEQQATQYLFCNFIRPSGTMITSRGFLNSTPCLYFDEEHGKLVRIATHAVALAVVGCWPGRAHFARLGEQTYGKALVATQVALQDPSQATSDGTLIAILLFSLYESITSHRHSIVAWRKHADGAVAIVKARGANQFTSPLSIILFQAVRTHMLLTSMHTSRPIPDFPGPKGWLSDIDADEDPEAAEQMSMAVALPNLLCQIKALTTLPESLETRLELEEALETAQDMQEKHTDFELRMPKQWSHRSLSMMLRRADEDNVDDLEAWPGPIHTYSNVHIASVRNNNRVCQALCSRAIMTAIAWLKPDDYFSDEGYCIARNRVQELVDHICFSVPFQTGQQIGENGMTGKRNVQGESGPALFAQDTPGF